MSVRGVWILSYSTHDNARIVFSRLFPTVERRSKVFLNDDYISIPDNIDLSGYIQEELGLKRLKNDKFLESRDTCKRFDRKPVFEIPIPHGKLWPMLAIEQYGYIFCCLSLVEESGRPPIINIPGISAGFSLLLGMSDLLGSLPSDANAILQKFAELHFYLGQAAPFGTPVDLTPSTVKAVLFGKPPATAPPQKQPAWKPVPYKGRNTIHCVILESIRAVQYDSKTIPDVWDNYGTITCHAELEGVAPDVSLTLAHGSESNCVPLENIITGPCVIGVDTGTQSITTSKAMNLKKTVNFHKIRFTPPVESFTLCHYTASRIPELPIKGYYQMKGETTVEVLIQLQLSKDVKNNFEYCELQIPFFHRGPILNYDASPCHGNLLISPDRKILVWNIGQKFPSKNPEIMLKATVNFGDNIIEKQNNRDDPFCVGQNSYIQLFFKIADYTYSGCSIDPKSIQISPNTKAKFILVREYAVSDYKIWNSHGDAQIAFPPPKYLQSPT
ncbi:AP-5 complex subunit mu-1-like [Tubulanus polymorphus]|uniref:AP-5 complex subunit mu-1-like n=1 Tax=Tubulanus polymorphus TaxID=672921 RepID=UPI003DA2F535